MPTIEYWPLARILLLSPNNVQAVQVSDQHKHKSARLSVGLVEEVA